jgi:hypothetical protein
LATGSVAAPVKTGRAEVVELEVTRDPVGIVRDVENVGVWIIVRVAEVEDVDAANVGARGVEELTTVVGAVEAGEVCGAIVEAVEVEDVAAEIVGAVEIEELAPPKGSESEGQYGCKAWNVSVVAKLTWLFISCQWHILSHNINRVCANWRLTLLVGLRALLQTTLDQLDKTGVVAKTLDIRTSGRLDLAQISVETALLYGD